MTYARCHRCRCYQYDPRFIEPGESATLGPRCCCPDRPVWRDAFEVIAEQVKADRLKEQG